MREKFSDTVNMPNSARKIQPRHHRIRSVSVAPISHGNVSGKGAVLFSIPFLFAGVYFFGVGSHWWSVEPGAIRVPYFIIQLVGLVFFFGGLFALASGLKRIAYLSRTATSKQIHLASPWIWDHPWNENESLSRTQLGNPLGHLLGLTIVACFFAFTYWLGFESKHHIKFPFYAICAFAALAILGFVNYFNKRKKYGISKVEFSEFPLRLGSTTLVTIRGIPSAKEVNSISIKIRYCQEEYSHSNRDRRAVHTKVLYEDELNPNPTEIDFDRSLRIKLSIPDNLKMVSKLSDRPASFWELYIKCEKAGIDFEDSFLLPIY